MHTLFGDNYYINNYTDTYIMSLVNEETVQYKNERTKMDLLIYTCMYSNSLNLIKCIVKNGADIHTKYISNRSVLQMSLNKYKFIKYFVRIGVEINILNDRNYGILLDVSNLKILKFLLKNKADIFAGSIINLNYYGDKICRDYLRSVLYKRIKIFAP